MKSPYHDLFDNWSFKKNNLYVILQPFQNKKFCLFICLDLFLLSSCLNITRRWLTDIQIKSNTNLMY